MLANNAQPDHHCPTCGQPAQFPAPVVDLNTNTVVLDGFHIRMSPSQAEFLVPLVKAYPGTCSYEMIAAAMWGMGDGPTDPLNNVKICAHHVRQKLRPAGWTIKPTWGFGYQIQRIEC